MLTPLLYVLICCYPIYPSLSHLYCTSPCLLLREIIPPAIRELALTSVAHSYITCPNQWSLLLVSVYSILGSSCVFITLSLAILSHHNLLRYSAAICRVLVMKKSNSVCLVYYLIHAYSFHACTYNNCAVMKWHFSRQK